MKSYSAFLILIIISMCHYSFAQTYIQYPDKTFGGSNIDYFENMIYLGNNQLLLAGSTSTYLDGDKTDPLCDTSHIGGWGDLWLLKVDLFFNIIWQEDVGGDYNDIEPRICSAFNPDRYFFACLSRSDSTCSKSENCRSITHGSADYWVIVSDSSGNKIWDKTLGGSNAEDGVRIIQLTTGDLIVGGSSNSASDGDKTVINYGGNDYWVVKLDTAGNKLWDKVYGGTGQESAFASSSVFCALACPGGDFILAGQSSSPAGNDVSDTSRGGYDVWIIKLDSGGTRIWDRRFGGSGADFCAHIIPTDDNGYILCGGTNSPQGGDVSEFSRGNADCWVIKLDSMGNKQWDKRYGGTLSENSCWIQPAPGGGYWVGASTNSDNSFDVSEDGYGMNDYWVFKIDDSGNKIWDKRFGTLGNDLFYSLIILPDSSILLGGLAATGISPVKTDSGKGNYDYWLVHFKYAEESVSINENPTTTTVFSVFPNPATDKVQLATGNAQKGIVRILNLMGEEVLQTKTESANTTIDIKHLAAGLYFITVQSEKGITTKKFAKE